MSQNMLIVMLLALFALLLPLTAATHDSRAAPSISFSLYHSNATCLSDQAGDRTYASLAAGSGCQRIDLRPEGNYKAPGAFSVKVTTPSPSLVLRLFDDTGCTDKTPDTLKDGESGKCASPLSLSGAGWMSFKVDAAT